MCQDCGCTLAGEAHSHGHDHHHHDHSHDHDHHHHEHGHGIHDNPQLNDKKTVQVITKILDANDKEADNNRKHFDDRKILALNLMSSPGSGKTTLLEKTAELAPFKFAVIEGDLETNKDADRIKAKGIPAYQITTGTACHLDAFMVHKGIHNIPLDEVEVVFVENVGNLVCPASYDVGTHINVALVSVPEGEDKIPKYPVMFRAADLIIITKTDLLPHFDFDLEVDRLRGLQTHHEELDHVPFHSLQDRNHPRQQYRHGGHHGHQTGRKSGPDARASDGGGLRADPRGLRHEQDR